MLRKIFKQSIVQPTNAISKFWKIQESLTAYVSTIIQKRTLCEFVWLKMIWLAGVGIMKVPTHLVVTASLLATILSTLPRDYLAAGYYDVALVRCVCTP